MEETYWCIQAFVGDSERRLLSVMDELGGLRSYEQMGEQICFARPFSFIRVRRKAKVRTNEGLLIRPEEKVVGGVRHQRLLSNVAGNEAAGRGSRSAVRVKTLNERSLGQ